MLLDVLACLLGILVLVEVEDGHVGTFAGEQHRHRAADTTVATGDDGDLAGELAGRLVVLPAILRPRVHQPFLAGFCLLLWG